MTEEPHAVVRLLLKRMESHPEEFKRGGGAFLNRWAIFVSDIDDFGSAEDKAVMREAMRKFRMDEIHEAVMDELVNGPDRRRKEMEEQDQAFQNAQRQRSLQSQQVMQAQQGYGYASPNSQANAYGSSLAGAQQDQSALLAQAMSNTKDQYAMNILNNGRVGTLTTGTITSAPTTTTWGMAQIDSIKRALKL